ncbi:MAG TPA: HepT-like ribonuclease domain-containing protein, partial [Tepidisphaeraceae bacterium]
MLDAADEIAAITGGQALESYLSSRQLRWAVERGFEIIGEALSQLKKIDVPLAEGGEIGISR